MKPFEHIGLGLVVLAALAACSQPLEEEPLPPGVEEIPVTTKSKEALAKFRKGERFRDVGRVKQANPIFENATGKDPRFSYAYLNAAYTAASVQELNEHLKLAKLYLEGKSEGERLLVEIAQTYLDNDAEKRVELAETLVEHDAIEGGSQVPAVSMDSHLASNVVNREVFTVDDIKELWRVERDTIVNAIRVCGDNIPKAAKHWGVSPSTIYRKRQAWVESDRWDEPR